MFDALRDALNAPAFERPICHTIVCAGVLLAVFSVTSHSFDAGALGLGMIAFGLGVATASEMRGG